MPFPIALRETLRVGSPLAYEMPTSDPERSGGVIILPQLEKVDQQAKQEGWRASVSDRAFVALWREYSRRHMENDWDIAPGEGVRDIRRAEVVGEQALEQLLHEGGSVRVSHLSVEDRYS